MRAIAAAHPVEQVGEKLRAMMPFIGKNKLVAGTKD
jgi:ketol-acid reductoisomerase